MYYTIFYTVGAAEHHTIIQQSRPFDARETLALAVLTADYRAALERKTHGSMINRIIDY